MKKILKIIKKRNLNENQIIIKKLNYFDIYNEKINDNLPNEEQKIKFLNAIIILFKFIDENVRIKNIFLNKKIILKKNIKIWKKKMKV